MVPRNSTVPAPVVVIDSYNKRLSDPFTLLLLYMYS